jgi:hypothetical protein
LLRPKNISCFILYCELCSAFGEGNISSSSPSSPSSSLNVLSFSIYNFHILRSYMQLIQFFILSFFISFIISFSHLFFGLPSGRVNIGFHLYTFFLPFSLPAFNVNGQASLIFVLLCDLLYSYVLLINLIHHLF